MRLAILSLLAAWMCGCSLPTNAIAPTSDRDAGFVDSGGSGIDAARPDATTGDDVSVGDDAAIADDAWIGDDAWTGPDAYAPDAWTPPTDAYSPLACTATYGTVSGFSLCAMTVTTCEFYATTMGGTCTDVCTAHGGLCLDGWDNSTMCAHTSNDGCSSSHYDQICSCTRP